MKLIEQRKLFFIEGKSDKVYEIDLCELSPTEYLVNFRYGRRGSTLKEGTKTPAAVSREKAEAIFSDLENEKRKKGYQTETETFMELPSLDAVDPDSVNGVILQRLQDAVSGKNTFKTEWKTSRVIWKAALLKMEEAIPFIIKLASKRDDMQMYSALWALTKLKAVQAEPLFEAIAFQPKKMPYLRNMASEGLLTITEEGKSSAVAKQLMEKLPFDIQTDIANEDYPALEKDLAGLVENKNVVFLSELYLLSKVYPGILSPLNNILRVCPFRPPYFKHIRAIYKLAQVRNDYTTLATLSYRFEKESPMFRRTMDLDSEYKQYVGELNKYVRVGAELKNKDSKVAFSQYTKNYFQKNSLSHLYETGKTAEAKEYLRLAVSTLLQYKEEDYSPAGERPQTEYGMYDYRKKLYYYTLINYPECYDSLLLSTILFGNDTRKLQPNLKYVYGQRTVSSNSYYYNPNKITPVNDGGGNNNAAAGQPAGKEQSGIVSLFKNIFGGKKKEEAPQQETPAVAENQASKNDVPDNVRKELHPEYWDSMPEAYVQLLMQARMNVIHEFAYTNLKSHSRFDELTSRLDAEILLQFINSGFKYPALLAGEMLEKRKDELSASTGFVGRVLDSNNSAARKWAQAVVDSDPSRYMEDLDFVLLLIFNSKKDNNQWLNELLQKNKFSEDRQQALLGKAVIELLRLDNTDENNALAKSAINRVKLVASSQFDKVSWGIVEQLILSPLMSNIWLASIILTEKSKKVDPEEIPVSVIDLFLQSDIPEVRHNGIELMKSYPDNFLIGHFDFVLNQVETRHADVLDKILDTLKKLVPFQSSLGERAVRHLVYCLIRKEKFEGAHALINGFVTNNLRTYWNTLTPKDITKLIHAQYRQSHLTGYEILKQYPKPDEFSLGQIISFGGHEILAIRQWCWNYYKNNVSRIKYEKGKALNILDSKWDDTRAFAFNFFKTEFAETDWDSDTLIGIVDSIRPDVEAFGKELITRFFKPEHALEYLSKLSQHPSVNVQAFVTHYLAMYASGNVALIKELEFYFRSVLSRVNKARVAKNRIFGFMYEQAMNDEAIAAVVAPVLDDLSAQSTVQDKATCIHILSEIKAKYPHLDMHLTIKNETV